MNDINININKTISIQGKLERPIIALTPMGTSSWRANITFPITSDGKIIKNLMILLKETEYNSFYDSWEGDTAGQVVIDILKAKFPIETEDIEFPTGEALENWFRNITK